jgi:NADPH-dependent 2,4-dienoyl-CoA reductase/sulfur reductase-like enzyme
MKKHHQIAVIGAGPAGLAAATEAARQGAGVVLFDEQPSPGGQIYRAIEGTSPAQKEILGKSYRHGETLARAFRDSAVDYRPGTTIWQLSAEREIGISQNGVAGVITADQVIVATGALERPFPAGPCPAWRRRVRRRSC